MKEVFFFAICKDGYALYPARVCSSNLGVGNQEGEEINWSSSLASLYIEREEVKSVWCAHVHLPGCMNETAKLPSHV